MMGRFGPVSVLVCVLSFCALPLITHAQSASSTDTGDAALQAQIQAHNEQLAQLDKEIAQYEAELAKTTTQKESLQNVIKQLDVSRKKLSASISQTNTRISTTQLQIKQLSNTIADTERSIAASEKGLAESLRRMNDAEGTTIATIVLSSTDFAGVWEDIDRTKQIQSSVNDAINQLQAQNKKLSESKTASEAKKSDLVAQKKTLSVQKGSLDATRTAQNELLTQTKSQEVNYQRLIAQKKAQEASLLQALSDLKSKFQYAVDLSAITGLGAVLSWPVDNVRITQNFGDTAFARSGAYKGKGHNGVDFGVSIGTPIKASLAGIVMGTGNTDSVRGCYSFGKWVMVRHANGLATLYAHLSKILVGSGDSVATGDVLGYSGETGYATGPHLHFGVYASASVQIIPLGQATNAKTACANAIMPVAPLSGYLDPSSFLPVR